MCSTLSALTAGFSWWPWRFRECDERHEALSLAHSNRTHKVSAWRSHLVGQLAVCVFLIDNFVGPWLISLAQIHLHQLKRSTASRLTSKFV